MTLELKPDLEGYADSLTDGLAAVSVESFMATDIHDAIKTIDPSFRHMFNVFLMSNSDDPDVLEIIPADEWFNDSVVMGRSLVRIGVSGVKTHVAGVCNDWRIGRPIAKLEDQDAEITCEKCRKAKGLEPLADATSDETTEGVIKVVVTSQRRRIHSYAYAEEWNVRIETNGVPTASHRFLSFRRQQPREGEQGIQLREFTTEWDAETRKSKITFVKDGVSLDLEAGTVSRAFFRKMFGHNA